MKIKYQFANEAVEIDVSNEWGSILIDLDRQEYNNNHKEKRRHYSLDACTYEGNDFATVDEGLEAIMSDDGMAEKLSAAIASLLPRQQKLIKQVFFEGKKYADIARAEGLDPSSVRQATMRALEKIKKYLK